MADEVSDILHALARAGYVDEVSKIRVFLEEQGKEYIKQRKMNAKINSEMAHRMTAAEKALKRAGIEVPTP